MLHPVSYPNQAKPQVLLALQTEVINLLLVHWKLGLRSVQKDAN